MVYIYNKSTDAYFNLALEEYLLANVGEEIFMLWQNDRTIVVGKNQNTLSEINYDYVKAHDIKVVRRLTGGGAVFHDMGNINYTYIVNDSDHITDFKYFTDPIIAVLKELGIQAELKGRNDLLIDGRKFSGNAQCAMKGRTMHHGTLLFSSEIRDITAALNVKPNKIQSKGIKSVASRVTNISEHLKHSMTPAQFIAHLSAAIKNTDDIKEYILTPADTAAVNKLRDEKYSTWEWNYGYSPKYNLYKEFSFNGGNAEIFLDIKDGLIVSAVIKGDYFGSKDTADIEKLLIGVKHQEDTILDKLKSIDLGQYIWGLNAEELAKAMF